jgi:hypothetical protein
VASVLTAALSSPARGRTSGFFDRLVDLWNNSNEIEKEVITQSAGEILDRGGAEGLAYATNFLGSGQLGFITAISSQLEVVRGSGHVFDKKCKLV